MSDIVISIENLSKSYQLGVIGSGTFRGDLQRWWARVRKQSDPLAKIDENRTGQYGETLWALKDINLNVCQGEVLGIIGRNGSGKSTLLKILSRITAPTSGFIGVKGHIASLLEVGTGFHPELTGRENVYLNGAIMGMRRAEVERKFDEIVDFSGVEHFIDTPVKRYSSGMYVRLAFAVAAHLEPDILVVDEVLAVGDIEFQKKCLGKMGEVASAGRTVLFVSHSMSAIQRLCPRSILLNDGLINQDGSTGDVIENYIGLGYSSQGEVIWKDTKQAPGDETVRLKSVRLVNNQRITSDIQIDHPLHIEIEFWNLQPGAKLCASIHLNDRVGAPVLSSANMHSVNLLHDDFFDVPLPKGLYRTICTIPANFLNAETYSVNVIILTDLKIAQVYERDILSFTVHDTGTMFNEYGGDKWIGVVRPKLSWQTIQVELLNGDKE